MVERTTHADQDAAPRMVERTTHADQDGAPHMVERTTHADQGLLLCDKAQLTYSLELRSSPSVTLQTCGNESK